MKGTAALVRFHLHRDRVRIGVWLLAVTLFVYVGAASIEGIYPTQADLDAAAASSRDNPAALAFNGPDQALDTLGGQVAFQIGAFGLSIAALMSLLMLNRLTRAEEDSGRLELIRSMAVGRQAPLAAAVAVVVAMDVALGVLIGGSLLTLGLPVAGSVAMGAAFTAVGLSFVGITAVTAQVSENPRVAAGSAGALLGLAFVVRAVGDVGDGTASWFSPIGLAQKARPYAGERWWPLLVAVVLAAALLALAVRLGSRRDFGAGLVASRPGPARAGAGLGSPLGLALRLQRGTVWWWSVAALLIGLAYGSIADSIEDFVDDSEALAEILAGAGVADLTDSYLATSLLILALLAVGFAIQAVLRLRSEETAYRAEMVLATPTSRTAWLASHGTVVALGAVVVVVVGGLGTGVAYAIVGGGIGEVPRLAAAALVYLPAVWVLAALTFALVGVLPRWSALGWAGLALTFVIAMFGTVLDLPSEVLGVSPFHHTPDAPAASFDAVPVVVLTALAAALTAIGFVGFARRDVAP